LIYSKNFCKCYHVFLPRTIEEEGEKGGREEKDK
jgi:hypothetical protein